VSPEVPIELLAVASLTLRKGYDVLFASLQGLTDLPWHLTCAGSANLQPEFAAQLVHQVSEAGLAARVTFAGELGERELAEAYDRADVFVLPTRHEGYGMAVAEALARGVPVVSTPTGAIPDLVDEASGILVPIDDVEALSAALRAVLSDHALRRRLASGAYARRRTLPTWDDAAHAMATVLTEVSHGIVRR
jgi:glycosyltransferase involved in cell wall biosynthesis